MGIKIEFNPDLALRDIEEHVAGRRKIEECVPENLEEGKEYNFLKKEQRNYWLDGEIPLLKTEGNSKLSLPIASIVILEATHIKIDGEIYTKGKYQVVDVFAEGDVHFNGFARV